MTRLRGRLVKGIAWLAALLAGVAVLCLDGVDYSPYFRAPYYAETMARLPAPSPGDQLARGELQAGFGRAVLTPTVNAPDDDPATGRFRAIPLAGYGSRRGRPATGTHDDLHVKAVALRVGGRLGVMASADALIIPIEVTDLARRRLAAELNLSRDQIFLSATHTHASLGGWGEGWVAEAFAGGFQPGAREWFADRIVAAVREALADLQPASLGHGRFAAPQYVRNRLVGPLGQVDAEFNFLAVRQTNGRLGVIGAYAAHATVLPSSVMEFSGDYPGFWQRAVEEATGGIAVFMSGAVGSHAPVAGDKGLAGARKMGEALARTLVAELPQVSFSRTVTLGLQALEVALPPLHVRITDGLRLRPWLAQRVMPVRESTILQALRLNESVWISTPCDFSGELALGLKDTLRPRGLHAVVTSFNGDYVGYVISPRYYHLNSYESRTMSFLGPNTPEYFMELIRTLALRLADP